MNKSAALWPGYYDIVILPPAAIRDYAIDLSQRLFRFAGRFDGRFDKNWRLGKRKFLPHISLYHIPVRDKDFEPFLDELQRVVDTAQWGVLETAGFDMPVIMMNKPDWLKTLHRRVVHRTLRYFDWEYGVEKMWNLHRFSGRRLQFAKRYLRRYGTPMAGMNFRPHMTLSSFKGEEPADPGIPVRRLRFRADRLHVCELGVSHTCHRIVRELLPRGAVR